jgi:hypothetical protein
VDDRFAIGAAVVFCLALAASSASSLRAAKSRVKSTSAPLRSTQSRSERLAAIAAEINAYLLVLAIGLGALDLAATVALNLPDSAALGSSSAGQDDVIPVADSNIAATLGRSFP